MIHTIDINKFIRENRLPGPVTSNQLFLTNSYNFHPHGLMSEEIFGLTGSTDRSKSMSWIELNCKVIHPVLYDIVSKKIERKIPRLISGETTFDLDDEIGLIDPPEGEDGKLTGMVDLIENIHKLKFRNFDDGTRGKLISMLYKNIKNETFFIDKLLVCSPVYRDVTIHGDISKNENVEIVTDELTKLYRRIIEVSSQARSLSGPVFDVISYRMQLLIREIFELVKNRVAKKHGMIRNQMLGKRVDFSARSVITPNPELEIGEVGIPLRMICGLFEPYLIYGLVNSPYADMIPDEFHTECKKYLGKESLF